MFRRPQISLEGFAYWVATVLIACALLLPPINELLTNREAKAKNEALIVSYVSKLGAPTPPNTWRKYQTFIAQNSLVDDSMLNTAEVQTRILQQVRGQQARLIDLQEIAAPQDLGSLTALAFRLDMEGDLQAMLQTIEALGQTGLPILIEDMELRAIGRMERPDQLLRLSIMLTIWRERDNA